MVALAPYHLGAGRPIEVVDAGNKALRGYWGQWRLQRLRGRAAPAGIRQKNGKPTHPQTQGKVGAVSADAEELARAPSPPSPPPSPSSRPSSAPSPAVYNHQRPHRALPAPRQHGDRLHVPPQSVPGDRAADTHDRVAATDHLDRQSHPPGSEGSMPPHQHQPRPSPGPPS